MRQHATRELDMSDMSHMCDMSNMADMSDMSDISDMSGTHARTETEIDFLVGAARLSPPTSNL